MTGLTGAASIPAGATIERTSWHVAHHYGPGDAHATERDALVAGIAEAEARVARYHDGTPNLDNHPQGSHPVAVERFTVDLRWKMAWNQGTPDANGRSTYSCGIEQTVRRTTYETLADARAHLARIDKYATTLGGLR